MATEVLNGLDPRSMQLVQKLALYFAVDLEESEITFDCLERAEALVQYRNAVRKYLEPIEADNQLGRLQQEILRELKQNGGKMRYRDLCRNMGNNRYGTDLWRSAYTGLRKEEMITEWHPKTLSNRLTHMVGIPKVDEED